MPALTILAVITGESRDATVQDFRSLLVDGADLLVNIVGCLSIFMSWQELHACLGIVAVAYYSIRATVAEANMEYPSRLSVAGAGLDIMSWWLYSRALQ